jgi:hypothetical protein
MHLLGGQAELAFVVVGPGSVDVRKLQERRQGGGVRQV